MLTTGAAPVTQARWQTVLSGLCAAALDCQQTTFAVLADLVHGPGTHLALGARWPLRSRRLGDPRGLEPDLTDRWSQARDDLGLRTTGRWSDVDGAELRRLAENPPGLYAVADAYHLPWLPYYGQQHMPHSFLVTPGPDGVVRVVDAYHNDTVWGPARPGVWDLTAAEFAAAVPDGATALAVTASAARPAPDPSTVLPDNANAVRAAQPGIDRYLAAARSDVDSVDGLSRLVLDVWLLSRELALHAAWLAAHGSAGSAAALRQAEAWQRMTAQSYVTLRRARRGRPAGGALVDDLAQLLAGDTALSERLAADAPAGAEAAPTLRATVVAALTGTLGLDESTVRAAPTLRDLPGFNSFRLVDVIDQVEQTLHIEVPADRLVAGDLRDVDTLCRLFAGVDGREP